ncbi:hypothetical protein [Nitrosopumilus sp.]|uniref:hypothetical protein n=1 Tax=Nitrosopumilus sp. TaxID=2024843 RepID=UPI002610CD96|nr:hypothetical protein [Nitrosopumilus sp.]
MGSRQDTACMQHTIAEINGENICIHCGIVMSRVEVQGVNDWKTHNIKLTVNPKLFNTALKITQNLHLPQFALNTITQVSTKLILKKVTKKNALLYGIVYACRIHNIPRLLTDIVYEMEKISGTPKRNSEKTLLKKLNQISKIAFFEDIVIQPPDKKYYLQAYLAKIQKHVEKETSADYFNTIRVRAEKAIQTSNLEPSICAEKAIIKNISTVLMSDIRRIIFERENEK